MQKPNVSHYTRGDKRLTVTFQLSADCDSFKRYKLWELERAGKAQGFPEINDGFERLMRGAVSDVLEGKPFTNGLSQGFSRQSKVGKNVFTVQIILPQGLVDILNQETIRRVAESPTLQILIESMLLGSPILRAIENPQQAAPAVQRPEGSLDIQ